MFLLCIDEVVNIDIISVADQLGELMCDHRQAVLVERVGLTARALSVTEEVVLEEVDLTSREIDDRNNRVVAVNDQGLHLLGIGTAVVLNL